MISSPNKGCIRSIKTNNNSKIAVAYDHGFVCIYDIRKLGDYKWNSPKG